MRIKRTFSAFLLAPLAVPFVFTLGQAIASRSVRPAEVFSNLVFDFVYPLPFAYAAELILGLPAWWIFRRYAISSPFAFALTGGAIGCIVALLLFRPSNLFSVGWILEGGLPCSLAGLCAALIFRSVIRYST